MIWPFLFAFLVFVLAFREIYDYAVSFLDYFMDFLLHLFMTFLAFLLGVALAGVLTLIPFETEWTGPEKVELYTLRGTEGVSGRFYLGTGNVNTDQYYFFYKKVEKGLRPDRVKVADNATFYEQDRVDAELNVYTFRYVNRLLPWFLMELDSKRYEFFIPNGSIKQNYTLQ